MVGFAVGGVLMGRLADRFGIVVPAVLGALMLGIGYLAAASATALWQFMLAQALLIGMLGSSATFGPLVADVSLWFVRRRGIAVAIVASGNYLAGTSGRRSCRPRSRPSAGVRRTSASACCAS